MGRRTQSIVRIPICSEDKTGSIERDWLKSQVDYQISESFDWHSKELFLC